jgi:serine/threonine protein phosphatase PrpC
MSAPTPANKFQIASLSDRGLSEKRPLNEDSFLADPSRGIFAVADGVGGAEAGEVASQTAIDVLDEAFRHKLKNGDDPEDLMELAIQRANSSIHQMASEHPRFSMMATTIVALYVNRDRATIGHVGDSRLYRITPAGEFARETEDHSIVEEEVRAGRMTREQAANHPSKNVISRALGAEPSVEVDMKTIEVEDGTTFLLCTDGITRHIPDNELHQILTSGQTPETICGQLKERCFERGAEDNLTAVIVQLGTPNYSNVTLDDERTVSAHFDATSAAQIVPPPASSVRLTPPSRIAFPAPGEPARPAVVTAPSRDRSRGGAGRAIARFFLFIFFIAAVAGAFYGGMLFQRRSTAIQNTANADATARTGSEARTSDFQRRRSAVDADPQKWLNDNLPAQFAREGIGKAMDSKDSEFLYLYGRALMLTGNHHDALQAFDAAISNLRTDPSTPLPLGTEVKLAEVAEALKIRRASGARPSQEVLTAEQKALSLLDDLLGLNTAAPLK